MSSRVELYEQIRRDRRLDPQVSARTLAKKYRVSRRTRDIPDELLAHIRRFGAEAEATRAPFVAVAEEYLQECSLLGTDLDIRNVGGGGLALQLIEEVIINRKQIGHVIDRLVGKRRTFHLLSCNGCD